MLQPIKWNIILVQKVEILKMASKMAVSYVSKTYMTGILDKKHFKFDSSWLFRG